MNLRRRPSTTRHHLHTGVRALEVIADGDEASAAYIARVALLKMGLDEQAFRRGEKPYFGFVPPEKVPS